MIIPVINIATGEQVYSYQLWSDGINVIPRRDDYVIFNERRYVVLRAEFNFHLVSDRHVQIFVRDWVPGDG